MMNFRPITISIDDRLGPATVKQAKILSKRIEALSVKRGALQTMETEYSQAPLTEIKDWSTINRTYAELLIEELTIRQDIAEWEKLQNRDESDYRSKMKEATPKAMEEVKAKLYSIGYDERSLLGQNFLNVHPEVRRCRIESQREVSQSDTRENIAATELELQTLRKRKAC